MATYSTSDFRKGLKLQIDGDPYVVVESTFRKPGKGNAIYTLRMKNLVRGTLLERNYKGGESVDAADVEEVEGQYLYRQGDNYVFMDTENYEQYELTADQVGEAWKFLKDGTLCQMVLFNENPITITPPNHIVLKVEYCEPGAKGNTATNVTKPVKVETGAEFQCPSFVEIGELIRVDTRTGEYVERVKE